MVTKGNLFHPLPSAADGEVLTLLTTGTTCRLLRIVSDGQTTPVGEWYDQPEEEWVIVLKGTSVLCIENEAEPHHLSEGDWLHLPAHCRHRVEQTSHPTIWLALHYQATAQT